MKNEDWVQQIVEAELKREVIIHDDRSLPGMYDLRIGPVDAPEMAIECIGAVDPTFTETWNVGPAKEPPQLSITGDWYIEIAKEARVNKLWQRVEGLLQKLEGRGINEVPGNYSLMRYNEELFKELESLSITYANCFRLPGTGEVQLGMSGYGGVVDNWGSTVPEWVSEFLLSPERRDVLDKLEKSGAKECHVFITVAFRGAPWSIFSYLSTNLEYLPSTEPDLPPSVTGVWIARGSGTKGIRWDNAVWRSFMIKS